MKKFKTNYQAVLEKLGLVDKAKAGTLSRRERRSIENEYKKMHGSDFHEDLAAVEDEEDPSLLESHNRALEILNAAEDNEDDTDDSDDDASDDDKVSKTSNTRLEDKVEKLAKKSAQMAKENMQMREALNSVIPDEPKNVTVTVVGATGLGLKHTEAALFGNTNQIFNRDRRWNQLFLNPQLSKSMSDASQLDSDAFNVDMGKHANMVSKAYMALKAAGMLNAEMLRAEITAGTIDTTALTDAGLGDQFVQFRTLELLARVLEVPSVFDIFPLRSNIQDRELITNAYIDELSQAYQDSESALKGGSTLQPELGYVDDAMILSKFGSFKSMERQYIAYLNTNGSDPVKWTMIEYFLLLYMKKARQEQSIRLVRGIYAKPEEDTPGHYLNASTGIIYRMITYYMERKLLPFTDTSVDSYDSTGSVFIEAVIALYDLVHEAVVSHDGNMTGKKMYLNANHKNWYKKGYRALYNLDGDFNGIDITKVPDTDMEIVWVPNMGQIKLMWVTDPGNLQTLENIPGEMYKMYMERRLNNVFVQSVWKEGTSSAYAGKKEADLAALQARNYLHQSIFMNRPSSTLAADATSAEANNGFWFVTQNNAAATNITAIANKVKGVGYIVECGGTTNASTVNKAGDFSEIKANFVPTAVGDMLLVIWDGTKYQELARIVGGTLSWNAALQPNAIGAR